MDKRAHALRSFAQGALGTTAPHSWQALAGDAGSRRYFRWEDAERSVICVDAPLDSSNTDAFLAVRKLLDAAGMLVPRVYAQDDEQGFMLLSDLGEQQLFDILTTARPSSDYHGALPLLHDIQCQDATSLPAYSASMLREELSRFSVWFCEGFLNISLTNEHREMLASLDVSLVDSALSQPQVFVHRDYHCRNLMLGESGELGLIDFQDAVRGPLCYDLVSLLKDCYLRWPTAQVRDWALSFRSQRMSRGLSAGETDEAFLTWFDWMGLQRHLKVLGNFTRLALREGRTRYLGDIPLVCHYIEEVLAQYDVFSEVWAWWRSDVGPLVAQRDWGPPS
ncbi:MAG: phosphotransferase [Pseudomonadota bacterium]